MSWPRAVFCSVTVAAAAFAAVSSHPACAGWIVGLAFLAVLKQNRATSEQHPDERVLPSGESRTRTRRPASGVRI